MKKFVLMLILSVVFLPVLLAQDTVWVTDTNYLFPRRCFGTIPAEPNVFYNNLLYRYPYDLYGDTILNSTERIFCKGYGYYICDTDDYTGSVLINNTKYHVDELTMVYGIAIPFVGLHYRTYGSTMESANFEVYLIGTEGPSYFMVDSVCSVNLYGLPWDRFKYEIMLYEGDHIPYNLCGKDSTFWYLLKFYFPTPHLLIGDFYAGVHLTSEAEFQIPVMVTNGIEWRNDTCNDTAYYNFYRLINNHFCHCIYYNNTVQCYEVGEELPIDIPSLGGYLLTPIPILAPMPEDYDICPVFDSIRVLSLATDGVALRWWKRAKGGIKYQISCGPANMSPDSNNLIDVTNIHQVVKNLNGLRQGVQYAVCMRTLCRAYGVGDTVWGDWSDSIQFRLPEPIQDTTEDTLVLLSPSGAGDLTLSPNPTIGKVTVSTSQPVKRIEIYTITGQLLQQISASELSSDVLQTEATNPQTHLSSPGLSTTLDFSYYTSGTYVLRVFTEDGVTSCRLVVK